MELLTEDLKNRFKELGEQKFLVDPIVVARFFSLYNKEEWYAIEYKGSAFTKSFLGYFKWENTNVICGNWGYFSSKVLEKNQAVLDTSFVEQPISKAVDETHFEEICKPTLISFQDRYYENHREEMVRRRTWEYSKGSPNDHQYCYRDGGEMMPDDLPF